MSETLTVQEEAPKVESKLIPVYIMGKRYDVPDSLTIMKAMEYAGYKYIRGAGCRGGVCGACATVYRLPGDYHIRVGLACQTVVLPEMYLTQIPFYPANRAVYDWENIKGRRRRSSLPTRSCSVAWPVMPAPRSVRWMCQ